MSTLVSPPSAAGRRVIEVGPLLALLGAGGALAIGLAFGFPTPDLRIAVLAVMGALIVTGALIWPFPALLVMFASCIVQIVWVVTDNRGANAVDILLLPLLLGGALGSARRSARAEDAALPGPLHEGIRRATRRLVRSTVVYFAIAAVSLVMLAARGHGDWAFQSGLLLLRAIQGICLFAPALWWIRDEGHVRAVLRSVEVGVWLLIGIDLWFIVTSHVPRAGMTWVVNDPEWPISSPNEAAVTLLVAVAMIRFRARSWRDPAHLLLLLASLVMLVLTQSRSGLIAWVVYGLFSIRWRWSTALRTVALVALIVPLIPASYLGRMVRTLTPGNPSVEAYGSIIRLFTWQTAWKVFLDHPLFGVGYMGFRFVSATYNHMQLVLNTVENYFFEITTDLGLVGLIALGTAIVALFRLEGPVRAAARPGSHCQEMVRRHRPLVLALLAANMTGDNFMGMVGLAQIALWSALLIRSGHASLRSTSAA